MTINHAIKPTLLCLIIFHFTKLTTTMDSCTAYFLSKSGISLFLIFMRNILKGSCDKSYFIITVCQSEPKVFVVSVFFVFATKIITIRYFSKNLFCHFILLFIFLCTLGTFSFQ